MSPRRKTIHEAGVSTPRKKSLQVRDDRTVQYEDDTPIGNYAIRENSMLVFCNRIVSEAGNGLDYRTISNIDY